MQVSLCEATACSTPSEHCHAADSLSVDPASTALVTPRGVTSSPGNAHLLADVASCPAAGRYEVSRLKDRQICSVRGATLDRTSPVSDGSPPPPRMKRSRKFAQFHFAPSSPRSRAVHSRRIVCRVCSHGDRTLFSSLSALHYICNAR